VRSHRDRRAGWGASIALHLLLLLWFLLWKMQLTPFVLDFTPVNFAPLTTLPEDAGEALSALASNAPVVELPRRPMLDENALLKLPDQSRRPIEAVVPRERPETTRPELDRDRGRMLLPTGSLGRSDRPSISPADVDDSWLAGDRQAAAAGKIAGDEMFTIRWEGPIRNKISGELPLFPPGVNRDVTVRLSFDVAPDGAVVFVAPAAKGVPELERASIEALRTWRFGRLDPAQPQTNQRGEISFIYKLK